MMSNNPSGYQSMTTYSQSARGPEATGYATAPKITSAVDVSKENKMRTFNVKSKSPSAGKSLYDVKGKPERVSKEQRSRNKEM